MSKQEKDTLLDTNLPQFQGDTELGKTGVSPGKKLSKSTVQHKACSVEQRTPLPWNLTRLPQRHTHIIALCLCKNMTLNLTDDPPQKNSWLNGRAGLLPPPPRIFFLEFPLISVNSMILFGAQGKELRVLSQEEGDFYLYTKSIPALGKLCFEGLPAMCWTYLRF